MSTNQITLNQPQDSCSPPTVLLPHSNQTLSGEKFVIDVVTIDEIDDRVYEFWLELHQNDPQLRSPNFHPDFTQAVASVRDDVRIALLRFPDGELAGIFPFQLNSDDSASPVGGRMNDYHGVLMAPGIDFELTELFSCLGLKRFSFHAVSPNTEKFDEYKFATLPSFSIDLSNGSEKYLQDACAASRTLKELPRKGRGLIRDFGPIRMEHHCKSAEVLEQLIELKSGKYVSSNTFDILSVDWAANLLRAIHRNPNPDFGSLLSVLWAGDSIVAAHFGLVSGGVMQYWFPAFDPNYSKYSPGLQLMVDLVEYAGQNGIDRIDLSYGSSRYKTMFSNSEQTVLYGQVNQNSLAFQLAKQRYHLRNKLKEIPLKKQLKYVLRQVYPGFGGWNFK